MANEKQLDPKDLSDAKSILHTFVIRARRVQEHSMVKDHSVYKYQKPQLKWVATSTRVSVEVNLPDNEEVMESLVSRLRPYILSSESIFLPKVFTSVHTVLKNQEISEDDWSSLQRFEDAFNHAYTSSDRILYKSFVSKDDSVTELTDHWLAESWLYIDSVHSDPHKEKKQGLAFTYAHRYFAATSFFSYLAILVVKFLDFLKHLSASHDLGIRPDAWTVPVIVTNSILFEGNPGQLRIYTGEPGTPMPSLENLDPENIPGFHELEKTDVAVGPSPVPVNVRLLDKNGKLLATVPAKGQASNGILRVLLQESLLIELDVLFGDADAAGQKPISVSGGRIIIPKEGDDGSSNNLLQAIQKSDSLKVTLLNGPDGSQPTLLTIGNIGALTQNLNG
ncbi:hypothetical protein [Bifidobacterium callitrichidarum]|nr:hypothetical protein [Bifidobacterium callitrichidarum]